MKKEIQESKIKEIKSENKIKQNKIIGINNYIQFHQNGIQLNTTAINIPMAWISFWFLISWPASFLFASSPEQIYMM